MPALFPATATVRKSWRAISPSTTILPPTIPDSSSVHINSTLPQISQPSHVELARYRLSDFIPTKEKSPNPEPKDDTCAIADHVTTNLPSSHPNSNQNKADDHCHLQSSDSSSDMRSVDLTPAQLEAQKAEAEFSWELYLTEMNAYPVSLAAFPHVSKSLSNDLQEGQYLEYVYPSETSKKSFWYIELLHARSSDIYVRYFGLENVPSENFWLDLHTAQVFAFNACNKKIYGLRPPKIVQTHRAYLGDLLEKSKKGLPSPSSAQLATKGTPLKDRFKVGQWLEIIDEVVMIDGISSNWPAVIRKNIGGRLQLEYWTPAGHHSHDEEKPSTWIFCTDARLQEIGWCHSASELYLYDCPAEMNLTQKDKDASVEFAEKFGKQKVEQAVTGVEFPKVPLATNFAKGHLVEFVHPKNRHQIVPAVIRDVNPDGGMAVEVIDLRKDGATHDKVLVRIRHGQSLDVLPVHWCKENGVRLTKPPGWTAEKGEFSWQKMVDEGVGSVPVRKTAFAHLTSTAQPSTALFARGQKLEVSNPAGAHELCTATVVKVIAPLLWVHIDSYGQSSTFILPFDSTDMYPVGFCGSNADSSDAAEYPLKLPRLLTHGRRMATIRSRSLSWSSPSAKSAKTSSGDVVDYTKDTTVYINPKCHCGPLISTKKMVALPKCMGPGPVQLVLSHLVQQLISCGMAPTKLIQLVQATGDSPRSTNWERHKVYVKFANRSQVAMVDVVKNPAQVPDFLRTLCILLEMCPSLITTEPTSGGRCPEHCHQFTKPDSKVVLVRKKPLVGAKSAELVKNMQAEDDEQPESPKVEETRRLRSAGGLLVNEDDSQQSQYVDDDGETAASSRAGSLDGEPATKRVKVENPHIPPPIMQTEKLISLLAELPLIEESSGAVAVTAPPSPSVSDPLENSGKENENLDAKSDDAGSTLDLSSSGALADDSEYVLQFYKDPRLWSVEEVYAFLCRQMPGSAAPDMLKAESIDGDALLLLCVPDFHYLRMDKKEANMVGVVIERLIFSMFLNQQRVPLCSAWK